MARQERSAADAGTHVHGRRFYGCGVWGRRAGAARGRHHAMMGIVPRPRGRHHAVMCIVPRPRGAPLPWPRSTVALLLYLPWPIPSLLENSTYTKLVHFKKLVTMAFKITPQARTSTTLMTYFLTSVEGCHMGDTAHHSLGGKTHVSLLCHRIPIAAPPGHTHVAATPQWTDSSTE